MNIRSTRVVVVCLASMMTGYLLWHQFHVSDSYAFKHDKFEYQNLLQLNYKHFGVANYSGFDDQNAPRPQIVQLKNTSKSIFGNTSVTLTLPLVPSSTILDGHSATLEVALSMIRDPVFVVYGNRGYRNILSNFVCNMALFPAMHNHILVLVSDQETAIYLRSFSSRVTIYVTHNEHLESYDFQTPGYLRLMLTRGLILVDLLGVAHDQSKSIIWLEPDFHYMQNLLYRPEITETTSDLVLFLDHEMYCGCFIRFSPVPASQKFYKEVMDRMQTIIHTGVETTHDQTLLNAVLSEMRPNFTVFDKCLYRSGVYNSGDMINIIDEYKRLCAGIRAVAQHHNWIIGADAKIQMSKKVNGWFLNDDSTCKQRDMLVVVMTMNRPQSLKRLLHSLDTADYKSYEFIDLRITVDRDSSGRADQETIRLLESMVWSHGFFEVIVWQRKMGIYGQWIHAWPAELYQENQYKAVLLLEDDLEVSPFYAHWFIGAHQAYGNLNGVGAVTGQRPNLVAALNGPASVSGQVPKDVKAFGYKLIATWSLSPKPSVWREFRQWVLNKRKNSPDFVPLVPGIVPNQWYEHSRSKGEEENMWEMWFIRYMDERNLFTVYPWVNDGDKTIVGNWMEHGLHFNGIFHFPRLDFPILNEWNSSLLTQSPLHLVGYDLNFEAVNPL